MLGVTTSLKWPMSRSFSCRPRYVGRSSMAEHRTVTADREGSTPFDPPKFIGTVAER